MTSEVLLFLKSKEEEIPRYLKKLVRYSYVKPFSIKNHEYNMVIRVSGESKEKLAENVQNVIYCLDQELRDKKAQ